MTSLKIVILEEREENKHGLLKMISALSWIEFLYSISRQ